MKRFLLYAIILVMACGIHSCKSSQKDVKQDTDEVSVVANDLTDKRWKLVELMGKPVTYSSESNREAYIQFKADGTVHGHLSCNTFNGQYVITQPLQIRFSNMVNTLMMCMDMEIETEFAKVLQIADNYNVNGDELILNRARMAPLARFEAVYLQ